MVAQSTALILALGAVASAQTFNGVPSSITCLKDDLTNSDVTRAQIESAIVGPQGDMIEESASNRASGYCSSSAFTGIPLYSTVAGDGDIAGVSYAYDKATDTYTFCLAQGAPEGGVGYPSRCTEN